MPIELTCVCGRILHLPDDSAATKGQCPACGRELEAPARHASAPGAIMPSSRVSEAVTADPGRTQAPTGDANDAIRLPPYPSAPLDEWCDISRPAYKLWSPGAIGVVAFLSGPAGALLMMAINYARLGKRSAAWSTAAATLVVSAGVLAVAFIVPENNPAGLLIGLPVFLGIWMSARLLQGELYDAHLSGGGAAASGWSAFGMGVLGIVVIVAVGAVIGVVEEFGLGNRFGARVDFGNKQEVYFTRGATEADAHALGGVLRQAGFFDGQAPASVQVARDGEQMIVAFVVQPWALNDVQIQREFRDLGQQASAQAFAGRRVEVWLCDEFFEAKKKLP
jgi:hypothetical protein